MKAFNIKTKVIHSESKLSWNVVSTKLGSKYKIARVPYYTEHDKQEALEHAKFISQCFNNPSIMYQP